MPSVHDSRGREVFGLADAASCAGVTHQTIANWVKAGLLTPGTEPETLSLMNARKSGRRHRKYYYRSEIEKLAYPEPDQSLITPVEAAKLWGVTPKTIQQIATKHRIRSVRAVDKKVYLDRAEIGKCIVVERGLVEPPPPLEPVKEEPIPRREPALSIVPKFIEPEPIEVLNPYAEGGGSDDEVMVFSDVYTDIPKQPMREEPEIIVVDDDSSLVPELSSPGRRRRKTRADRVRFR